MLGKATSWLAVFVGLLVYSNVVLWREPLTGLGIGARLVFSLVTAAFVVLFCATLHGYLDQRSCRLKIVGRVAEKLQVPIQTVQQNIELDDIDGINVMEWESEREIAVLAQDVKARMERKS